MSGSGAFLQLAFVTFGFILAGFAAATLVSGWASDETDGRLEALLSTPLSRRGWAVRGGLGLLLAIGVFTPLLMVGIGLGSTITGGDVADARCSGSLVHRALCARAGGHRHGGRWRVPHVACG